MTPEALVETEPVQAVFRSLIEVQEAHITLLRHHREAGATRAAVGAIRSFLKAGIEAGCVLDSDQDRWAAQSILDYWVTTLHRATGDIPDATLAEFDPALAPILDDALCPYVGLEAFQASSRDRFFGREPLISRLVDGLQASRLLAVLGPSGSGKSSLVLAGLVPALRDGAVSGSETWVYWPPIVPGAEPLESLARALLPLDASAAESNALADGFRTDFNRLTDELEARPNPDFIVIDQFEELFTLCRDDGDRRAFVENLLRLARSAESRNTVVLTMRDDFIAAVSRLPDLAPQFDKMIVVVVPPTAAELREAIERPAERIGLKFEDGVVDALVKDVVNEPAGLPLLQFTLLKLWESRDHNRITMAAYKRLGGGRECLARSAEAVWDDLALKENRDTAKAILLELVRPTEGREFTSNRVRRQRLYQLGIPANRVKLALERLVRARLLRVTPGATAEDDRIEVAHEALVRNWPRFTTWLEEERGRLRHRLALTAAAEQYVSRRRDRNLLWRGQLLDEASRYGDLNEIESEFVNAGLAERRRLLQKRKLIQAGGITLVLIAIVALGFGLYQAKRSGEESEQSLTRMRSMFMAGQAARPGALSLHPDQSVLLALYAMSLNKTSTSIAALEQATLAWGMPRHLKSREFPVLSVSVSRDRRVFATASGFGITLWHLSHGTEYRQLMGHAGAVNSVAFDPTGTRLVSGSSDGTAKVWDVRTGKELRTLAAGQAALLAVRYSPDGRWIVGGGIDDSSRTIVWEASSGKPIATLRGPSLAVWDIAFSPDGGRVLAAGQDGHGLIWSTKDWSREAGLVDVVPSGITRAVYSRDGRQIATAGKDSTIRIWAASDGSLENTIHLTEVVSDVSFSPDGNRLASASWDGTVRIWDLVSRYELRTLRGHTGPVNGLAFYDRSHVLSVGNDSGVIIWNLARDLESQRLQTSSYPVRPLAISQDGRTVIAGSDSGSIWLYRRINLGPKADSLSLDKRLATFDKPINSLALDGSASFVAVVTPDSLYLVDVRSGRVAWRTTDSDRASTGANTPNSASAVNGRSSSPGFWSVAFSPDEKYLAVAGLDSVLRVFQIGPDGARIVQRKRLRGEVVAVAFNPQQPHQLVSSGRDPTIRMWDAATGKLLDSLTGHTSLVLRLAYDSAGTQLASASADGTVRVWDMRLSGGPNQQTPVLLQGHRNWVWGVSFSRDGKTIATTSTDSTVRTWSSSGEGMRAITLPGTTAQMVEFGSRGEMVIGGADGTLRVYGLTNNSPMALMLNARSLITRGLSPEECRSEMKLNSCPPTVESWLEQARLAASKGDSATAYRMFRKAERLDHELKLRANTYLVPFFATHFMWQADSAARDGRVGDVATSLRSARQWDDTLPIDPEADAIRLTVGWNLAWSRWYAANDQADSAAMKLDQAVALDPTLSRATLEGENERLLVAYRHTYANRSDSLARATVDDPLPIPVMKRAIAMMDSALAWDRGKVTAFELNSVCWFGALQRLAMEVMPYCDSSVAKAPGVSWNRDSRGLARALAGNRQGAIEDFRAFFNDTTNPVEQRKLRHRWYKALESGTRPYLIFTDSVLTALKYE